MKWLFKTDYTLRLFENGRFCWKFSMVERDYFEIPIGLILLLVWLWVIS